MWQKKKKKIENYEKCLEATQFEKKIRHIEQTQINVDCLKKDHEEIIIKNNVILKTQQIFNFERQNILIKEINKIDLSSNDGKKYNQLIR